MVERGRIVFLKRQRDLGGQRGQAGQRTAEALGNGIMEETERSEKAGGARVTCREDREPRET